MRCKHIPPGPPQDWLRHAKSDLAIAQTKKSRNVLYNHLCFHAQQAAEKAVKAVLVRRDVYFPKTHDLAYLLDLLSETEKIHVALVELPVLTKYAIQQRYLGDFDHVTRIEHRRSVALAVAAIAWAEQVIA